MGAYHRGADIFSGARVAAREFEKARNRGASCHNCGAPLEPKCSYCKTWHFRLSDHLPTPPSRH